MKEIVETNWVGNLVFESDVDGFNLRLDADEKNGGTHHGPRPKPVVLGALAACTGMDIISILKKKQVVPLDFRISAVGELTEEYPKYYNKIHLVFKLTGKDFENNPDVLAKAERAILLSSEHYCAVSAMIKTSCEITHEVILQNPQE
jgi:putative redox protein